MRKRVLSLILALTFIATVPDVFSQTTKKAEQIDFLGGVDNGVYLNGYFGFSLSVPKGWKVIDAETTAALMQMGTDVVKGKNERSNKALEESIKQEVVLLNVTKKPIGALENAMVMIGVRKQPSKHITASMVAEATKSLFASSPTVKLTKDVEVVTVAGKKFAAMEFVIDVGEHHGRIKYFVAMVDGFALSFSLSYDDEADFAELKKSWDSLKFSPK